jgi:diguanylate cyclase (GGDEF)-like protein
LSQGQDLIDYNEPILGENGKTRYATTSKYILRDSKGEPIGLVGITKDITQFYITRQRYHQELKYLFELPKDTYAVSYIDVDAWRVITQRRQEIGEGTIQSCLTVEELAEAAVESIVDKTHEAVEFYRNFTQDNLLSIFNSGRTSLSFEYERYLTDGTVRWVQNNIKFMTDVDSGHLCAMLFARDIDDQKKEEAELVFAAKMDKMTMVLNRETSMDYIRETLEEDSNKRHVLFMTDIDNFKNLNDTMGHQKGDEFLMVLAKAIKNCFRETDIVGRIGGDEFFAFMKNTGATSTVEKKAKEMLSVMRKVCANYPGMDMSGSIGVSIYPDHGTTLEELYAKADVALYQAKRTGKDKYVFYKE